MALFGNNKKKEEDKRAPSMYNTPEESQLVTEIENAQMYAEGGKRIEIEVAWDDEYKVYQGGGKQWDTSKGKRSSKGKKRNFNSEENFILPMVRNMLAPFTTPPTMEVEGIEPNDNEAAEVLSDLIPYILDKNKFSEKWNKGTEQFVKYGLIIGHVGWDQHWIGGTGPDKWVGEIVADCAVKKDEFYPDPAILDLEERLQECSYINIKKRKKLEWYREMWPEKGKYVSEDTKDIPNGMEDEGQDPKQATLIIHYHKGTPKFISDEWKKIFQEKADEAEANGLPYKAEEYRDMAKGTLKGVHCAYMANGILLDYIPYIYDDGLYPFVYKVLYADEKQPYGMGEIRNTVIPQLLRNKADEIELGAMLSQGLGGGWYNKNAISPSQKEEMLDNIGKANAWFEVNDFHGIKERQPVQVPAYISNYKTDKKDVIDIITGNTAILQGISVGANVPYKTIAELGKRADARTRHKAKVLESFMIEFVQLIVNRIVQFYTTERKYRILGDNQMVRIQARAYKTLLDIANAPEGTDPAAQLQALVDLLQYIVTERQKQRPKTAVFRREMLVHTWERDVDDEGNPKKEEFIPEFDIKVKVMDERPTDRDYYINLAVSLFGSAIGPKSLWRTIDSGRLPPIDDILEELEEIKQAQAQAQMQALQVQAQMQQQEKQLDLQAALEKIALQNQSMERQVALSAAAKVSGKHG
jgi:hypothetical protein